MMGIRGSYSHPLFFFFLFLLHSSCLLQAEKITKIRGVFLKLCLATEKEREKERRERAAWIGEVVGGYLVNELSLDSDNH